MMTPASTRRFKIIILVLSFGLIFSSCQSIKPGSQQPSVSEQPRQNKSPGNPQGSSQAGKPQPSLLFEAVTSGNLQEVQSLIKRGANVNVKNQKGLTPLHVALRKNKMAIARELIAQGADVNARESHGVAPLHIAAGKGLIDIQKLLIARGADIHSQDNLGLTPLHYAATFGHLECTRDLIARGANVNARSKDGFTPLTMVEGQGFTQVENLIKQHGGRK